VQKRNRRSRLPWIGRGERERQQTAADATAAAEPRWHPGVVDDGGQADPYQGAAIYDDDGEYIGQEWTEQQKIDAEDEAYAEAIWIHNQGGGWPSLSWPREHGLNWDRDPPEPEPDLSEPEAEL
jgi:hypothetical protein